MTIIDTFRLPESRKMHFVNLKTMIYILITMQTFYVKIAKKYLV